MFFVLGSVWCPLATYCSKKLSTQAWSSHQRPCDSQCTGAGWLASGHCCKTQGWLNCFHFLFNCLCLKFSPHLLINTKYFLNWLGKNNTTFETLIPVSPGLVFLDYPIVCVQDLHTTTPPYEGAWDIYPIEDRLWYWFSAQRYGLLVPQGVGVVLSLLVSSAYF